MMLTVGPRLSTMLPVMGPAVVQLPAASHTLRLAVAASAVSVPWGTAVARENEPSAGSARPEPTSVAVQAMLTSPACHCPSAATHSTSGADVSDAGGGAPVSTGRAARAGSR